MNMLQVTSDPCHDDQTWGSRPAVSHVNAHPRGGWTLFSRSHLVQTLKAVRPGQKVEPAGQWRTMTQRVHLILPAASLVPQTLNNLAAQGQASITMLACSYSLHRLKEPRSFLTLTTCCMLGVTHTSATRLEVLLKRTTTLHVPFYLGRCEYVKLEMCKTGQM